MRYLLGALLTLLLAVPASAKMLELDLTGTLRDDSVGTVRAEVFRARFLLPTETPHEIFTGPYSIGFQALPSDSGAYKFSLDFYGLGPDFHNSTFKFELAPGDSMTVPPLPVKDGQGAKYDIRLLSDTAESASNDTAAWGVSESVHFRTHWMINSYADFLWNVKMAYLELIYDGYRKSFGLSEFEKINFYMHPEPTNAVYLDLQTDYAIQPRARRIDLVFGYDIDAASPRPAAELLMYRQWGYGPRWMVSGFACYYEDVFLQARKYSSLYKPEDLAGRLSDEVWIEGDTGSVLTGAFTKWLIDTGSISKFRELYQKSTELDYRAKFASVYGKEMDEALGEFIAYIESYQPKQGEFGYFATEYMKIGNFEQAREYLEEAGDNHSLALCEFWLGNYKEAARLKGLDTNEPVSEENRLFHANMLLAQGLTDKAVGAYRQLFSDERFVDAGLPLASYYLDQGEVATAAAILDSLGGSITVSPEYFIESGRLKIMRGEKADSLLTTAVSVALNRAQTQPHEPVSYLMAGQAFLLMGQHDMARDNLEVSLFLEKRPFFIGQTLVELGRLADLEGNRDEARDYYGQVLGIKAGAYQKYLAKKYLKQRFTLAEAKD